MLSPAGETAPSLRELGSSVQLDAAQGFLGPRGGRSQSI